MSKVVNDTGIEPLADLVLLFPLEVEQVSKGGIVMPTSTVKAEALAQTDGRVLELGPECATHKATKTLKAGDVVIFAKYGGLQYEIEGKLYRMVRAEDIIGRKRPGTAATKPKARARQNLELPLTTN